MLQPESGFFIDYQAEDSSDYRKLWLFQNKYEFFHQTLQLHRYLVKIQTDDEHTNKKNLYCNFLSFWVNYFECVTGNSIVVIHSARFLRICVKQSWQMLAVSLVLTCFLSLRLTCWTWPGMELSLQPKPAFYPTAASQRRRWKRNRRGLT